jgi:hypothetical protein
VFFGIQDDEKGQKNSVNPVQHTQWSESFQAYPSCGVVLPADRQVPVQQRIYSMKVVSCPPLLNGGLFCPILAKLNPAVAFRKTTLNICSCNLSPYQTGHIHIN